MLRKSWRILLTDSTLISLVDPVRDPTYGAAPQRESTQLVAPQRDSNPQPSLPLLAINEHPAGPAVRAAGRPSCLTGTLLIQKTRKTREILIKIPPETWETPGASGSSLETNGTTPGGL